MVFGAEDGEAPANLQKLRGGGTCLSWYQLPAFKRAPSASMSACNQAGEERLRPVFHLQASHGHLPLAPPTGTLLSGPTWEIKFEAQKRGGGEDAGS